MSVTQNRQRENLLQKTANKRVCGFDACLHHSAATRDHKADILPTDMLSVSMILGPVSHTLCLCVPGASVRLIVWCVVVFQAVSQSVIDRPPFDL
ncbi:hypothetical protein RRG08_031344 [Elysia crispata]|uniref:Uncharacterized protein n=1 Tax=Elysia crispata TaxID=231223 RepID=A0AAE0YK17_9GAST|nr:hypothetical protein RRG08_031344 [Elysia crispata]